MIDCRSCPPLCVDADILSQSQAAFPDTPMLWALVASCLVIAVCASIVSVVGLFQRSAWLLQLVFYTTTWLSCLVAASLYSQAPAVKVWLSRPLSCCCPGRRCMSPCSESCRACCRALRLALFVFWRAVFPLIGFSLAFERVPPWLQTVACLGSPAAALYGFEVLNDAERLGRGIHWATVFQRVPQADVQVPLGVVLLVQLVDWALVAAFIAVVKRHQGATAPISSVPLPSACDPKSVHWHVQREVIHGSEPRCSVKLSSVCKVRHPGSEVQSSATGC